MNEQSFVARHDPEWRRLAELCDLSDRGLGQLSGPDLKEFLRLYRRATTDLSVVRTRSNHAPLVDYLNDLVGRAYGILYRAPRRPILKAIGGAVRSAAQTFRRRLAFVGSSAALFLGSALLAFSLMATLPDTRDYFVPPQMEAAFAGWKSGKFQERTSSEGAMMTGFYASNNPRAAIVTGAIGAGTFGIGSIYLLFTNGALVGSLAYEVTPLGHLDFLLSSIAPHGVTEISGLILSGAAGLLLGWALIHPGRRTRGESLRAAGPDAVTLLATSVALMFIAAPIEGFFSFNPHIPGWLKLGFAGVSALAWALFWTQFARDPADYRDSLGTQSQT